MALVFPAFLGGCSPLSHGFLAAAGPIAAQQRHLFWIIVAVLAFVVGPVLILTPLVAWHYRMSNKGDAFRPNWNFSWTLEGLIWIPPTLIVVGLAVVLWINTARLDPYRPIAGAPPLEVQVVASDWKWLFVYSQSGVASVNRLVLPVGRPVQLHLTSTTVMRSFMVPQLGGQIYAMAGMATRLNLQADKPGVFRGADTQYSGRGFPLERFAVVAVPPAQFDRWLTETTRTGPSLAPRLRSLIADRGTIPSPFAYAHAPASLFAAVVASGRRGDQTARQAKQ